MNKKQLIITWLIFVFASLFFIIEAQAANYEAVDFKRKGNSYDIDVQYPKIIGNRLSVSVREGINKEIERFVHGLFAEDLKTFIEEDPKWTKDELKDIAGRNLVMIKFKISRMDEQFVSIIFEKYLYGIGAAHGLSHIYGFNYDVKKSGFIKLADLFEPKADYLKQISEYCVSSLKKRLNPVAYSSIEEGAAPKEENLKDFTISRKALNIHFSDYQVSCYADGCQDVEITFSKLLGLNQSLLK